MSPTKIFHCRILKQFVNQIILLCDGKCHYNAAKTILRQLIVAYPLKWNFELTVFELTGPNLYSHLANILQTSFWENSFDFASKVTTS